MAIISSFIGKQTMTRHENEVNIDLHMAVAIYEAHKFCITMEHTKVSLLDEDGNLKSSDQIDNLTLAVFFHEYTHFLHNISTVAGWLSYDCLQGVVAIFSQSLNISESLNFNISPQNIKILEKITTRFFHIEGDFLTHYQSVAHNQPSKVISHSINSLNICENKILDLNLKMNSVRRKSFVKKSKYLSYSTSLLCANTSRRNTNTTKC